MISIHNIRTVANYEAKTLRRSWLFRLFSIGAIAIVAIFNIAAFSPVGDEDWTFLAIPSSLPLVNLYLLNIAQAMIIIFLASDFLKRDKKLDTNEVLYTRPMSNFEYVTGKSLGILKLFVGLNLLVMAICLVINIIAKNTYVDIWSYFTSLLIVSLPTLIFSLGFAYLLMTIIRNQSITFLLLLGFVALNMFYLYFRVDSIFDYMLFGMPVVKSQIAGYAGLDMIIAHRLLYTFTGFAFILVTILMFKRLPQSKTHRMISYILLALFTSGALFSGYFFLSKYYKSVDRRVVTIETNRKYEDARFLKITDAGISLKYTGKDIEATAELQCTNPYNESLSTYYFSLNPGLIVRSVKINGSDKEFTTDNHIIIVDDTSPLGPSDTRTITITYDGTIDESYIDPWYKGNIKDDPYRIGPVQIKRKQSFVGGDYLLLTAESGWYPVASLNYYPDNPARIKVDFTKYTLSLELSDGMVPVSQGRLTNTGNNTWTFENETPLTGLSLVAGSYQSETITVDSIDYSLFYFKGHDYFRNDLNEIGDTVGNLISGVMTELEINFNTSYPFKELSLVEVPIQYRSTPRKNTQTMSEVQPSMILLPEKLANITEGGFYRNIKRQKRRQRGNQVVTDKELQVRAFNQFVRNTFISGSTFSFGNNQSTNTPSRYLLGPSFYFFKNNFYSNQYPVINAVFESHLQKVSSIGNMARGFLGGLSESDRANTIMKDISLKDLLGLDPSNDTLRLVLTVKGDYLFNIMRARAGIKEFNDWFIDYVEKNKFRNIDMEKFDSDLNEKFGFSIIPYLHDWYEGDKQPGFYFTDTRVDEVIIDNRTRFLVSFTAANPLDAPGLFNVSFMTGGRGMGMRGGGGVMSFSASGGGRGSRGSVSISAVGRGMQTEDIYRVVLMDADQAKRVNILLDNQPRSIMINTVYSINNPGEMVIPMIDIERGTTTNTSEEDEILPDMPPTHEENEIIVDNEDPGFRIFQSESTGRLKNLLGINRERGNDYTQMFGFWAPEYWQKTIQGFNYGEFIKSAVYTRSGAGERYVSWTARIKEPGYYDIYTYIGRQGGARMMAAGRGGQGGQGGQSSAPAVQIDQGSGGGRFGRGGRQVMQDLHYTIEHDDGTEEVTIDSENAENGWNLLGSFYLSPDTARVILTNASSGRSVSADAIKWVKQNSSNQ